ncbi:unnamed protein product [Prorocentrum cordatum]|uniref:Dipeptidase n=1 Tax=Prorocentrum cordatum TaxID=2364126 RepID=A0ABN9XYM8_9DINO|nr:unnamed protein product [Polarella glacialis]|mmetsp:Transcript_52161/g.138525  ORF Transcript_52161/g.138525 Transcript_52161/m.138525 type:complete len:581 (+) Transcript_52161:74-1816(+)
MASWQLGLVVMAVPAMGCTNFIVSKQASADNSVMFSYSADSGPLYGTLGHYPAADHPEGAKRQIYDWDGGFYIGEIPEARHTYNVIGNVNEHGLAIGETTFGGNETLASAGQGLIDYGSLIWIALQRCKTAREAIKTMTELVAEYGYASEGESFTIADTEEVWVMDLIGKGKYEKGAVWVAHRVPDGHIAGHANQARIRTFPQNDPDTCIFSHDVIDFARRIGLYPRSAADVDFSFSDAYDPISFSGARMSDARIWSFFSKVGPVGFEKQYEDYVTGRNLSNRFPPFVLPREKVTLESLMMATRSHYEGTPLDDRDDVGAGPYHAAFRARPLAWKHGGNDYFNERKVGTEQTGWNFVAQLRGDRPAPLRAVNWFGVDDTSYSVRVPFYGGTTTVPKCLADGNGDALTFSFDSQFWVNNMVANFVYTHAYAEPIVVKEVETRQELLIEAQKASEAKALELFSEDPEKALNFVTQLSNDLAEAHRQAWLQLWQRLFVQFRDGFNVTSTDNMPNHGPKPNQGGVVPKVEEIGYDATWLGRIASDTGDRYRVRHAASVDANKVRTLSKGVHSRLAGIERQPIVV